MCTFDTHTLSKRKNEISAVSRQASAITSLLEHFCVSIGEVFFSCGVKAKRKTWCSLIHIVIDEIKVE